MQTYIIIAQVTSKCRISETKQLGYIFILYVLLLLFRIILRIEKT